MLGRRAGSDELHYLLEDPFGTATAGCPTRSWTRSRGRPGSRRAPLYAVLHEACYAQGAATRWAAQRVRAEFPEFDPAAAVDGDGRCCSPAR